MIMVSEGFFLHAEVKRIEFGWFGWCVSVGDLMYGSLGFHFLLANCVDWVYEGSSTYDVIIQESRCSNLK